MIARHFGIEQSEQLPEFALDFLGADSYRAQLLFVGESAPLPVLRSD